MSKRPGASSGALSYACPPSRRRATPPFSRRVERSPPAACPLTNLELPDFHQDRIDLHGLGLVASIGVPPEERALPQRLEADLSLWPAAPLANLQEDLSRTVNYYDVALACRSESQRCPRLLIETLAEDLCRLLLQLLEPRGMRAAARRRPRATVQVKKFTTGDATVDNASNFEDGAANQSTLAATSVTVNQITKTFTVTQQELNQGFALSDLAQGSAEIFALGISKKVTAQMTAALFGAGTVIGTAANFDSSDLPAILALAKNYRQKLLLLDGGHMARLMFSGQLTAAAGTNPFPDSRYGPLNNGYFGFANILEQNDYTGAIANTVGFVCGQDAIAVASGLPVGMIAGEFLEQRSVELSNGLSVLLSVWYSRASRAHMASYDIMFGAAAADTTQAEVLITA